MVKAQVEPQYLDEVIARDQSLVSVLLKSRWFVHAQSMVPSQHTQCFII